MPSSPPPWLVMVAAGLVLGTLAAYRRARGRTGCSPASPTPTRPPRCSGSGSIAIWIFSVTLGWLPAGGLTDAASATVSAGEVARHMVLPVAVLAFSQSSWLVLFVRESVIATLWEDHVLGARARGLRERTVLFGHALRAALLPFLTLSARDLPNSSPAPSWSRPCSRCPASARYHGRAALAVDFPLLAALTLLATAAVVLGNLLADPAYVIADPRVRVLGVS